MYRSDLLFSKRYSHRTVLAGSQWLSEVGSEKGRNNIPSSSDVLTFSQATFSAKIKAARYLHAEREGFYIPTYAVLPVFIVLTHSH